MAHGFRNLGKHTTFASKKELAWHKLGKVVESMTSREAIKLGGMDFEVALKPLYTGVEDIPLKETSYYKNILRTGVKDNATFHNIIPIKTNFATVRTDTNKVFGIVGSRYEVIQNHEAFDFFDEIIGQGHAAYETVGALGFGEKVFITAKMPNKLIVKKENIDKYLLLTMAHDGSGSIQAMFTPVRVVCNNTLSAALGNNVNKISIRHTKNARDKMKAAQKLLGVIENQSKSLSAVFNAFADKRLKEIEMEQVICSAFGFTINEDGKISTKAENKLDEILEYHEQGIGQEGIKGTAWGLYNAVTGYQQNIQKYNSIEKSFDSIYTKTNATVRQKTFNLLNNLL